LNAGALDPTFGTGGIVIRSFPDWTTTALATAVLPNGDYLVLAGTQVLRLLPDGSPDAGFGTGGAVALDFDPSALALAPDGSFLVVGRTTAAYQQPSQFEVERFTPQGSLDSAFGAGGRVITPFGASAAATAVALQSDGKIVVVGADNLPPNPDVWDPHEDFAVERLNPDGSLDVSFGTGGQATLDFGGSVDAANAVAIQPDGKIIVSGSSAGPTLSSPWVLALARLNPDGSPDNSFGAAGKVTTAFGAVGENAAGLVLQPDGKIVQAGWSSDGNTLLVRYNPSGGPDATFGTGGKVLTPSLVAGGLALQADGDLVVAGARSQAGNSNFALARYLPDGTPDPNFGTGGVVTTDLGTAMDTAVAVTVQGSGAGEKILVAGTRYGGTANSYGLVRYLGSDSGGTPGPLTLNQRFVYQVYWDLLGRPADAAALAGWGGLLDRGASRAWVVQVIEQSPEHLTREVQGLYQTLLGRPAAPLELASWVTQLESGGTLAGVEAQVLASPEYFQRNGGTGAGFVAALYRDVLGRVMDPGEGQAFVQVLAQGVSRTWVARAVLTSPEAAGDRVQADYHQYLRRAADVAGLNAFTDALVRGTQDDEQIIAAMLSSPEYLDRLRSAGV
jgi:uncharacterized delta-60 repeat protein